ncbi:MAG: TetR/AcrR family transcriptional regulator [Planctomycetota bacterium]
MSSAPTKERLLEAAWSLMKRDAEKATLAAIAAEAGVSRQALHLHFGARSGLLLEMVRWVDERSAFFEKLEPIRELEDPAERLRVYVCTWLDYLPALHPVPGYLARARSDVSAREAWNDRMEALESLYRRPLKELHVSGQLSDGLKPAAALDLVRTIASVHAWEFLVHERGWSQKRTTRTLWSSVEAAILRRG